MSQHPPFLGIDDRKIKASSKEIRLASDVLRSELGEG